MHPGHRFLQDQTVRFTGSWPLMKFIIERSIDRYESRSFDRRFFETKFVLLEINCEERERESETGRNKRKKLLLIELEGNELRSARMSEVKRVESGRGSWWKRRGGGKKKRRKKKKKAEIETEGKRDTKTRGRDAVSNYATELDAIDGTAFRAELQDSTTSFHFPNSRREPRSPKYRPEQSFFAKFSNKSFKISLEIIKINFCLLW